MRWTKSHSTVGVTPLIHCCIPFPDSYSLAWSRGGCISGGPAGWWGRRRSSWNGSCSSTQWLFDCIYQRVPNKTKQLILTFKDVLSGLYNYSLSGPSVDSSFTHKTEWHPVKTNALVLFYCHGAKHSKSLRHDGGRHTTKRETNQTSATEQFYPRGLIPGSR